MCWDKGKGVLGGAPPQSCIDPACRDYCGFRECEEAFRDCEGKCGGVVTEVDTREKAGNNLGRDLKMLKVVGTSKVPAPSLPPLL